VVDSKHESFCTLYLFVFYCLVHGVIRTISFQCLIRSGGTETIGAGHELGGEWQKKLCMNYSKLHIHSFLD